MSYPMQRGWGKARKQPRPRRSVARWPNREVRVPLGWIVVVLLLWAAARFDDEPAFAGLAFIVLVWWAAVMLADWVDERNRRR